MNLKRRSQIWLSRAFRLNNELRIILFCIIRSSTSSFVKSASCRKSAVKAINDSIFLHLFSKQRDVVPLYRCFKMFASLVCIPFELNVIPVSCGLLEGVRNEDDCSSLPQMKEKVIHFSYVSQPTSWSLPESKNEPPLLEPFVLLTKVVSEPPFWQSSLPLPVVEESGRQFQWFYDY